MIGSLIQIAVGAVLALSVFRSLTTGRAYMWTKELERKERAFAFWAWIAFGTLIALASFFYGIEGLL